MRFKTLLDGGARLATYLAGTKIATVSAAIPSYPPGWSALPARRFNHNFAMASYNVAKRGEYMPVRSNIGIFGGDKRQIYIAKAFIMKGYHIYTYQVVESIRHEECTASHSPAEMFSKCSVLIGPIPLLKKAGEAASPSEGELTVSDFTQLLTKEHFLIGGIIPPDVTELCDYKGIPYYDLMKNEKITILNAIATAEGAIMEAIQTSNINLHSSKCLVLGYGRCAKVLAGKLRALDAQVTVAARSEEALAYAEASGLQTIYLSEIKGLLPSYDFIFNTIPALVLDKSSLELVKQTVVIIDIATFPGGLDYEYAAERKLNAKLCLGLPGKVAPKTSADILADEIAKLMKQRKERSD